MAASVRVLIVEDIRDSRSAWRCRLADSTGKVHVVHERAAAFKTAMSKAALDLGLLAIDGHANGQKPSEPILTADERSWSAMARVQFTWERTVNV
jgi:UDP-N-acetylmuramyl tripeptide synthase